MTIIACLRLTQISAAREDWSGDDIAGLRLSSGMPIGAEVVRFAFATDVWKHDFSTFGFPGGQDNGIWATRWLLDRQASNWLLIEDNKTGSFAVIPNFSEGPIVLPDNQGYIAS